MDEIDNLDKYIYNVFNFINESQKKDMIKHPKKYIILKDDLKVLKKIYIVYNINKLSITFKEFVEIVKDYSISTEKNIIRSAMDIVELLKNN